MSNELLKAHLNLFAVLQNLEDLVKLDAEMAELTRSWDVSIQFSVRQGPRAYLVFKIGACTHGAGTHSSPSIKLYFASPGHLNRMFDGKATPIPLKGITKLGFLQKESSKLTDRLAYYLKPGSGTRQDEQYARVNTILTLQTGLYAVPELALLEPTCRRIAAHIPPGALQITVLPDGPHIHLVFGKDTIRGGKRAIEKPMAKMTFRNLQVANDLLTGKSDAFLSVASGDLLLQGQIPMIDNLNLILDRVPAYLS